MINRNDLQSRNLPIALDGAQFLTSRTATVGTGTTQTIYQGFAYPGSSETEGVWMIQRTTITADGTTTLFAGGQALFNKVWAERVNQIYS
ncbi:MAG: hypothetical protein HQL88_10760 [Magnetococcales bacterium]|nr:hypothetical protein [Magnetococcales bacterium]